MSGLNFSPRLAFLLCSTLLFGSALASPTVTMPAPRPPGTLYRVDIRAPAPVFAQGIQDWASLRGGPANDDLLSHIQGEGHNAADGPASSWISTSHDIDYVNEWMNTVATGLSPPLQFWVYEIQPSTRAYPVHWAITEYLLRHVELPSNRTAAVQAVNDQRSDHSEWAFFGGIRSSDIRRGTRWNLDAAAGRYVATEVRIMNPHFDLRQIPRPRSSNPLDAFDTHQSTQADATYVYDPGVSAEAANNGTMTEAIDLPMRCVGPAAPGSSSSKVTVNVSGESGSGQCAMDPSRIRRYEKASKARPSKLAFNLQGGNACLTPIPYNGYVGAGFVSCDSNAPCFEYDEFKRLTLNWQKNHWCLAAPESVINGEMPHWDYLHFEPCALNSNSQKWSLRNGQILSYRGSLPMQEYGGSAMLSRKNDGRPMRISRYQFAFGFFNGPSPSRTHQVELKMGWTWNNSTYFSNTNGSAAWGGVYWSRSYYDYDRQTISHIYLGSSASTSAVAPTKFCLSSLQADNQDYHWNWTEWAGCSDVDAKVPTAFQWKMTSIQAAAKDPTQVQWQDLAGNALWVQATTHNHAGAHFTMRPTAEENYRSNSTNNFSVRADAILVGVRKAPINSLQARVTE